MRIVSWNCQSGFDRKSAAFLALKPDLGIVPESCSTPAISQQGLFWDEIPHAWTGRVQHKGLGIFAPGAERLIASEGNITCEGEHGLAQMVVRPDMTFGALGVWTIPLTGRGDGYVAAAKGIVERHNEFLSSGRSLIGGDFNVSGKTALKELTVFIRDLENRFGVVSAYHHYFDIPVGQEPHGTLWWLGRETAPFHCDFVFVPKSWQLNKVEVGTFEQWGSAGAAARSDHAPLIVDVTVPQ